MKFRTRFQDGNLTVGETKVAVAMIAGIDPEQVESFTVVTLKHVNADSHELIVTSNLRNDRIALDGLLYLAHRSVMDRKNAIGPEIDISDNPLRFAKYRSWTRYWKSHRPPMD